MINLCRIIDNGYLKDEKIDSYIRQALYDALKLYSLWEGNEDLFTQETFNFILENGTEGLKHTQYKNNIISIIDELSKVDCDKKTESEIISLIGYEQNNRTLIHQKLHQLYYKSDFIIKLENDIEKVSMGEKT